MKTIVTKVTKKVNNVMKQASYGTSSDMGNVNKSRGVDWKQAAKVGGSIVWNNVVISVSASNPYHTWSDESQKVSEESKGKIKSYQQDVNYMNAMTVVNSTIGKVMWMVGKAICSTNPYRSEANEEANKEIEAKIEYYDNKVKEVMVKAE